MHNNKQTNLCVLSIWTSHPRDPRRKRCVRVAIKEHSDSEKMWSHKLVEFEKNKDKKLSVNEDCECKGSFYYHCGIKDDIKEQVRGHPEVLRIIHKNTETHANGQKEDLSRTTSKWEDSMDHPSWSCLSHHTKAALKNCHKAPDLLFFISHPNMEFSIKLVDISSDSFLPVLSEKYEKTASYFMKVPYHSTPMMFAVLGEILWSDSDMDFLTNHFTNLLPDGFPLDCHEAAECVSICPGTGKRVPFSLTRKHLLVVCSVQVNNNHGLPSFWLLPRIMTEEGYKLLLGPKKDDRCLSMTIRTGDGIKWEDSTKEFYPMQLRIINANQRSKVPNLSTTFGTFFESDDYGLYKRFVEKKYAENVKCE